MPSQKGNKQKRLLGDNPTFIPNVFVRSHDYATVVIMFYSFCVNKVPSKAFGIVWMIVDLIMCKKRNFCSQSKNFENSLERAFDLNFLHNIDIQISQIVLLFRNFWIYRSISSSRLLQTIMLLTDSVFYVQFAYFDEPMSSIGRYEPWRSWNTVDITPI